MISRPTKKEQEEILEKIKESKAKERQELSIDDDDSEHGDN